MLGVNVYHRGGRHAEGEVVQRTFRQRHKSSESSHPKESTRKYQASEENRLSVAWIVNSGTEIQSTLTFNEKTLGIGKTEKA